jgi:hypothetical protein
MSPLNERTRRGLVEAILHPLILGGLMAVVLALGEWLRTVP